MRKIITPFFLALALFFSDRVQAQHVYGSFEAQYMVPGAEMRAQIPNGIWGVGLCFQYQPTASPVLLGVAAGVGSYANVETMEPFTQRNYAHMMARINHSYNVSYTHVIARVAPLRGKLRPYAEFRGGLHFWGTSWNVTDPYLADDCSSSNTLASGTIMRDAAFAWGLGGGLTWQGDACGIRLGVTQMYGGQVDYLIPNPDYDPNAGPATATTTAATAPHQHGITSDLPRRTRPQVSSPGNMRWSRFSSPSDALWINLSTFVWF